MRFEIFNYFFKNFWQARQNADRFKISNINSGIIIFMNMYYFCILPAISKSRKRYNKVKNMQKKKGITTGARILKNIII